MNKPILSKRRVAQAVMRRRFLLRWGVRFLGANIAISLLIALGYLGSYRPPASPLVQVYTPLLFLSHFTLLTTALWIITFIPLLVFAPRTRVSVLIAAAAFAVTAAVLILDVNLFAENQYHLNGLNIRILGASTWFFVGVFLLIALVFEVLLARALARSRRRRMPGGMSLAAFIAAGTVVAQVVHIWATACYYVPVTSLDRFLPAIIRPFTAVEILAKYHLVDYDLARETALAERFGDQVESPLAYPKKALECTRPTPKLNVAFIIVDTLRADMLSPDVMPETSAIASGMHRFTQHFSGGNKTDYGMFTLFYGLPATYMVAAQSSHVGPVLVRKFIDLGYDIGIFSTHDLYKNEFDQTIFADVTDLPPISHAAGKEEWQRDAMTVAAWDSWLDRRAPGQPFFGMVMLNALSANSAPDDALRAVGAGQPDTAQAKKQRYSAIAGYIDRLVAKAVDSLVRTGHWQDTIVIITSDHGQEFNESGLGYWGHGKAFTRWQLQVPMLISWPGREPQSHAQRTSHFDIVPTLVEDLFGCTNDPADYASGRNMFNGPGWNWIVASGNQGVALIEPDRVTTSERGLLEVRDANYHILDNAAPNRDALSRGIAETSTFFRSR